LGNIRSQGLFRIVGKEPVTRQSFPATIFAPDCGRTSAPGPPATGDRALGALSTRTEMRHYVALNEHEATEGVTMQLAACLAPKPKAELLMSHLSPPNGTDPCPQVPKDA
jgi:hypothetical protein